MDDSLSSVGQIQGAVISHRYSRHRPDIDIIRITITGLSFKRNIIERSSFTGINGHVFQCGNILWYVYFNFS
jgi:hypothetical protein